MSLSDRLEPPHSDDAERAVIGAILKDPKAMEVVAPHIDNAGLFYQPKHGRIFNVAMSLYARSEPVDITTVAVGLGDTLPKIGGRVYLVELVEQAGTTYHVEHHAKIVKERATRRQIISVCNEFTRSCYDSEMPADRILDQWQQAAFDIGQGAVTEGFRPLSADNEAWLKRVDALQSGEAQKERVLTGFSGLDHWAKGFAPGELIVIEGQTGQGKTQLALQITRHVAYSQNKTVGVLSLEMTTDEVNARIQCAEAFIDHFKVETPHGLTGPEMKRLLQAAERTREPRIFVDDSASLTPARLTANARRLKSTHNLQLLVVDYVQIMDPGMKADTREQLVAGISASLKKLAKSLRIPVMALSQVTVVGQYTHARESKAIENDADKVLLIEHDPKTGSSIKLKKQRRGPSNRSVPMTFVNGQWAEVETKKERV